MTGWGQQSRNAWSSCGLWKAPHISQCCKWDCGVACLQMVLAGMGRHVERSSILTSLGTCSVWTIDLAMLLHRLGIRFMYCTRTVGVTEGYTNVNFYRSDFTKDSERVNGLFQEAKMARVGAVQKTFTWRDLALLVAGRDCVAILLVDSRFLYPSPQAPLSGSARWGGLCAASADVGDTDSGQEERVSQRASASCAKRRDELVKERSIGQPNGGPREVEEPGTLPQAPCLMEQAASGAPGGVAAAVGKGELARGARTTEQCPLPLSPPVKKAQVAQTSLGEAGGKQPKGDQKRNRPKGGGGKQGGPCMEGSVMRPKASPQSETAVVPTPQQQHQGGGGTQQGRAGGVGSVTCHPRNGTAVPAGGAQESPVEVSMKTDPAAEISSPSLAKAAYRGHYILLLGFSEEEGVFIARDPALRPGTWGTAATTAGDWGCTTAVCVTPEALDRSRKSYGTDEDVLLINMRGGGIGAGPLAAAAAAGVAAAEAAAAAAAAAGSAAAEAAAGAAAAGAARAAAAAGAARAAAAAGAARAAAAAGVARAAAAAGAAAAAAAAAKAAALAAASAVSASAAAAAAADRTAELREWGGQWRRVHLRAVGLPHLPHLPHLPDLRQLGAGRAEGGGLGAFVLVGRRAAQGLVGDREAWVEMEHWAEWVTGQVDGLFEGGRRAAARLIDGLAEVAVDPAVGEGCEGWAAGGGLGEEKVWD